MVDSPFWYRYLLDTCTPKNHTVPDWTNEEGMRQFHRYTTWADLLSISLMPWQKLFLAQLSMPWVYEVDLIVGRQQGKTTVITIPSVDVMVANPAHTVVYSAQTGDDANRKIREEFIPLYKSGLLNEESGFKFNGSPNGFGLYVSNDSLLKTMSSAKESLRGATRVAFATLDEARADADHNRTKLVIPTMTVVEFAKLVLASTAGHEGSILLKSHLDKARKEHHSKDSGIALLEWGVEDDEEYNPASVLLWERVLPGLGYVCTPKSIKRAYTSMEPHDFAMEYLGKFLDTNIDVAVPNSVWKSVKSDKSPLIGDLCMAVDSPPEQDLTAAVVCDEYGQIELLDVKEGTEDSAYEWILQKLERNPEILSISMANSNTLKRTGERLEIAGYIVNWYNTEGMHKAASRFWEAIHHEPRGLAINNHAQMTQANLGAFRWPLSGGGWVFKRKATENFVSPLIAATMAYDAAVEPGEYVLDANASYDDIWKSIVEK